MIRKALLLLLMLSAPFAWTTGAVAEPSELQQKQSRAQDVMAQINQIDGQLGRAVEQYNLANLKLNKIESDLARNRRHLRTARQNAKSAEHRLADRVVALYTSGGSDGAVGVLLGAESLSDLLDGSRRRIASRSRTL